MSRRGFLKATGLLAASAGVEAVATACQPIATPAPAEPAFAPPLGAAEKYPDVPSAPSTPPDPKVLQYLTVDEARAIEAFTARIIPGTPQDPGAREAGVVTFIDNMLATNQGDVEPTYSSGPFAHTYDSDTPPPPKPNVIWVKKDELSRYGDQGDQTTAEAYRQGLKQLDEYAKSKFGGAFADLSEQQQDTIIGELAGGKVDSFKDPTDKDFFKMVHTHTIHGMFGDPLYGGNREMVGWKLVGYPGAQRAYTPVDLRTEGTPLPVQGLAQLPHFHAGLATSNTPVYPVSGTNLGPRQGPTLLQQFLAFCGLSR